MPSILSLLPFHGLEGGCVNKLSLSMQMKTPSWEGDKIKGIWILEFHGAEPLCMRDKHNSLEVGLLEPLN